MGRYGNISKAGIYTLELMHFPTWIPTCLIMRLTMTVHSTPFHTNTSESVFRYQNCWWNLHVISSMFFSYLGILHPGLRDNPTAFTSLSYITYLPSWCRYIDKVWPASRYRNMRGNGTNFNHGMEIPKRRGNI